ncbi:hypothetical protein E8F11_21460 [Pseudomonas sp. BN417]|uniref:hypothetical protein n=1 Tax=Pseudomonas sp. BN417 TaxID=2567890 RepID=UPI0024585F8E|nr:hypothetical protein [Pseudomonas sp. BN417]MDH4557711.1 hypothetical protein [Pseudomonas sp. BN417]
MTANHEQRRLQQLVQRLDARLHTTQVIAEVILENAALRDGIPGPFLDGYREGALMDAVIHLSRSNYEDFGRLVQLEKLPLGCRVI